MVTIYLCGLKQMFSEFVDSDIQTKKNYDESEPEALCKGSFQTEAFAKGTGASITRD